MSRAFPHILTVFLTVLLALSGYVTTSSLRLVGPPHSVSPGSVPSLILPSTWDSGSHDRTHPGPAVAVGPTSSTGTNQTVAFGANVSNDSNFSIGIGFSADVALSGGAVLPGDEFNATATLSAPTSVNVSIGYNGSNASLPVNPLGNFYEIPIPGLSYNFAGIAEIGLFLNLSGTVIGNLSSTGAATLAYTQVQWDTSGIIGVPMNVSFNASDGSTIVWSTTNLSYGLAVGIDAIGTVLGVGVTVPLLSFGSVGIVSGNPSFVSSSYSVVSPLSAHPLAPTTPTIDRGQSIPLVASPSGGLTPYAVSWYAGTSANCAEDSLLPGVQGTEYVASPPSSTYYCYATADSFVPAERATSPSDLVSVSPALLAGPVTPVAPDVSRGGSMLLAANVSGGTPPYSFKWYAGSSGSCPSDLSPISGATNSTYDAHPSSSTAYCYSVTDSASAPQTVRSAPDQVTVSDSASGAALFGLAMPSMIVIVAGVAVATVASVSGVLLLRRRR